MFTRFFLFSLLFIDLQVCSAQTPTWSGQIANLIYGNCTSCHRPGEIGPFSLTSYDEAAAWAPMIGYVTSERIMPPWKPDPGYGSFFGERHLSQEQIDLLQDWVTAGAPSGDLAQAPPLPEFPTGSQLGIPDTVLTMPEPFFIEGDYQDEYRIFVLPTGFTEDREIAAVEFRPGNPAVVHHVVMAYENEGNGALLDALDEAPGYSGFGDFRVPIAGLAGGFTPGVEAVPYPEGIGKIIPAGSDLLVQIHYAPTASDEWDQSSVNIFFKQPDDPIVREAEHLGISPADLPGGYPAFRVLAGEITNFHASKLIEEDLSLLSVQPHSHYLGKSYHVYAVRPDGSQSPIIRISDWDFNWQGTYIFRTPVFLPAGTILHSFAVYDNTASNPANPSDPPRLVSWGEGSLDEMMLVRMQVVPYAEGDEAIVLGQSDADASWTAAVDQEHGTLFPPIPNPASNRATLGLHLKGPETLEIAVLDAGGREWPVAGSGTQHAGTGFTPFELELTALPPGMYIVRVSSPEFQLSRRLMIAR